jgi:hypothetical protein
LKASLLLATRNRDFALAHLLEHLYHITPLNMTWEIVVADNGSNDSTPMYLDTYAHRLPLKSVRVVGVGKGRALNAAMKIASGDLLVFTDDDVQPSHTWLIQWLLSADRYPNSKVFGGRVLLDKGALPKWIHQSFNLQEILASQHDMGDQDLRYPPGRYPIGPNFAVRRDAVIAAEAHWLEDMGPGTAVPLGDERAFLSQISPPEAQDRMYVSGPVVVHRLDQVNLTYSKCWGRCFLGGLAAGRLDCHLGGFEQESVRAVIVSRLRSCKSSPELIAMGFRALGVVIGRMGR